MPFGYCALRELVHAVAGCALAAAQKGNCGAGAIGAGIGELTAEVVGNTFSFDPTKTEDRNAILGISRLTAIGVTALAGKGDYAATADFFADNAVTNNYLTHQQIKDKQGELAECRGRGDPQCEIDVLGKYDALSQRQTKDLYGTVMGPVVAEDAIAGLDVLLNDPACDAICRAEARRSKIELQADMRRMANQLSTEDAAFYLALIDLGMIGGTLAVSGVRWTAEKVTEFFALRGRTLAENEAVAIAARANNFYRDGSAAVSFELLAEYEATRAGSHFLGRHGAHLTDQQLIDRATKGILPDVASQSRYIPVDATRWTSDDVLLGAIKQAEDAWATGARPPNNNFVWDAGTQVGVGYTKDTAIRFNTSWIEVRINQNTGKAYTAFPLYPGAPATSNPWKF